MTLPPSVTGIRMERRTFRTQAKAKVSRCQCAQRAVVNVRLLEASTPESLVPCCILCAADLVQQFLVRIAEKPVVMREKRHKPMSPAARAAYDEYQAEVRARWTASETTRLPVRTLAGIVE